MKWLRKLYNKIRYRELYKELRETERELAEFQSILEQHRVRLKTDIETAHVIREIQKQEKK